MQTPPFDIKSSASAALYFWYTTIQSISRKSLIYSKMFFLQLSCGFLWVFWNGGQFYVPEPECYVQGYASGMVQCHLAKKRCLKITYTGFASAPSICNF